MIHNDKIYVAIDFKPSTETVLSYALWLCKITNCKSITLFHIMEYTLTPPSYLMPYINKEKMKIEEKFKSIKEKMNIFSVNIEYKVILGRLVESIKEAIKSNKAFAVIGFKSHITRPSTSERILKGMKIPTLIVKDKAFEDINPERIKIKNILCLVDFSEVSIKALSFAREFAQKTNSKLKVLHVVPEQKIRGIIEEEEQIQQYIDFLKEEAHEKLLKIDENLDVQIVAGNPAEETLKRTSDYDLVIIGSKGRSYSEAVLIGSVAESVIKNSSKPVLLIH